MPVKATVDADYLVSKTSLRYDLVPYRYESAPDRRRLQMISDPRKAINDCTRVLAALVRDPRFSSAATAISLNFFALAGVYFFMSFYLQNVRGNSPLPAELAAIPVAIGQLPAAGRKTGRGVTG
jgi:hypothetical protein